MWKEEEEVVQREGRDRDVKGPVVHGMYDEA